MAKSVNKSDTINHYNAVRIRVTGNGNLQMRLLGLDGVATQSLVDLPLTNPNGKVQTRLANFVQQYAQLELKTTEINEVFNVRRITIFVKPIATSYPG